MKIVFVTNDLNIGGAERALITLLQKYSNKYEIDLILLKDRKEYINSLRDSIPDRVNILSVMKKDNLFYFLRRKFFNVPLAQLVSHNFLKNKNYDLAITYGHWVDPYFVAKFVTAKHKYIWVHNDNFYKKINCDKFFSYDSYYDGYILPSECSKNALNGVFPFMYNKSYVIHNEIDVDYMTTLSQKEDVPHHTEKLNILSIGNIRKDKNYLRTINTARLLKEEIPFIWTIVGGVIDEQEYNACKEALKLNGLNEYVQFVGKKDNPYPYLRACDIFVSSSDNETWSVVISEAIALGKVVISTKTNGALEQIHHQKNGLLCDFDEGDLFKNVKYYADNPFIPEKITRDEKTFSLFVEYINSIKNNHDLLFVIDSINNNGGAHRAFHRICEFLSKNESFDIFTTFPASTDVLNKYRGINIKILRNASRKAELYYGNLRQILGNPHFSLNEKIQKIKINYLKKKSSKLCFEKIVLEDLKSFLSQYKRICVISEGSRYRKAVAFCAAVDKSIWIRTDYKTWRNFNKSIIEQTKDDYEIYEKFNRVLFVADSSREGFNDCYPDLANKTYTLKNIINDRYILQRGILAEDEVIFSTVFPSKYNWKDFFATLNSLKKIVPNFVFKIFVRDKNFIPIYTDITEYGLSFFVQLYEYNFYTIYNMLDSIYVEISPNACPIIHEIENRKKVNKILINEFKNNLLEGNIQKIKNIDKLNCDELLDDIIYPKNNISLSLIVNFSNDKQYKYITQFIIKIVNHIPGIIFNVFGDGKCRQEFILELQKNGLIAYVNVLGRRNDLLRACLKSDAYLQFFDRPNFSDMLHFFIYNNFPMLVSENSSDSFLLSNILQSSSLEKNFKNNSSVISGSNILEKILNLEKQRINNDQIKIITVGRIEEEKGIDRVINIANRLNIHDIDFLWTIIGDGKLRKVYTKLLDKYSIRHCVRFLGEIPDPYHYMKNADIFVLPSKFEGLSNVIFESMIVGTPVLTTDVSGVKEQIINDYNGWIVDNDEDALYNRLYYLLNNKNIIDNVTHNVDKFKYDNDSIKAQIVSLFSNPHHK